MTKTLEIQLDELAMQLLMGGALADGGVLAEVAAAINCLAQSAQEANKNELADQARRAVSALNDLPSEVRAEYLNKFVSAAQVWLKSPHSAKFPDPQKASEVSDVSDSLDPELLVEFIEKHTSLMEEFESGLVQLRYQLSPESDLPPAGKEEEAKKFERYAKGYIHNVKGDAGSIGLMGIERACHYVEDRLTEMPLGNMVEALLAYREWVGGSMRALAQGEPPPEKSPIFLKRFDSILSGTRESAETAPPVVTAPAAASDLPAEANLELLAELMAEGVDGGSPEATVVATPEGKAEPSVAAQAAPAHAAPQSEYQLSGDPEVFVEFATEAEDHLGVVEVLLLESQGKYTKDSIDSIFRAIHSIKGASSYFQLKEISETSHRTENLLDEVRDGERKLDEGLTELLLVYVSLQRSLIERARKAFDKSESKLSWQEQSQNYLVKLSAYEKDDKAEAAPADAGKIAAPAAQLEAAQPIGGASEESAAKGEKLDVKQFIKVDTQRLDQLIDSIGEMCIYSSMLIQTCRDLLGENERVIKTSHQVEKFSRDLQNIGMSMRLVPIRGLFQKMSRLVWDVSKKIGKDVKFQMDGEDTELDRTIIDKLADPLMHMVRNALDHGVEPPADREKAGKSRTGHVWLSASYSGGNIHIKIRDDGRGLDPQKLKNKAIEKGILTPAEAEKMSIQEAFQLIFAAGFSTAAVVTDISGRGVGMDVVRRNIESIRGRVHIESTVGQGATFTIELPLTLAIMDGIQVAVGNESFLVPTLSIVEFMRPKADQITRAFDKGETFHFRGKYLPVFRLRDVFGIEGAEEKAENGIFIVVDAGGELAALMVDSLLGTSSSVIKGLGDLFEQGRGLSGCAIMANGDVALILDVRSLITAARKGYSPGQLNAQKRAGLQALAGVN